jgi:hypothetical protein
MIEPVLAHGGLPGAIVEATVGIAFVSVFVAAWLRERSARKHRDQDDVTHEAD